MGIIRRQHVVNDQLISVLEVNPRERKHAETIVLLHGWGSQAQVWDRLMSSLEGEGYRVIAPDLPGFGGSEFPFRPFAVNDYAEILRLLLFQCAVDRYVLVGHSFGGRIAIKTAATQPAYLQRMILTGSAGIIEHESRKNIIEKIAYHGKKILPHIIYKKIRRQFYKLIKSEEYIAIPELEATFRNVVSEDLEPYISQIKIPVLLLWGSKDDATPLWQAKIMENNISRSELRIYEGAGHYVFLDDPERFKKDVISFLSTSSSY